MKRMARTNDYGHYRVRRYRIADGRRYAATADDAERRPAAEPSDNWACVSLGPGRRGRPLREQPPPEPPVELSRHRRRPAPEQAAAREPGWEEYDERDYDYYEEDYDEDLREPLPEREGLIERAARAAAAAWVGFRPRRRESARPWRGLLLAALVFAVGVFLENRVQFLSWAADALAAGALSLREWVNPGAQTALFFTGLVTVTGVWLLRRVIGTPSSGPRTRKRVAIDREAYERHL